MQHPLKALMFRSTRRHNICSCHRWKHQLLFATCLMIFGAALFSRALNFTTSTSKLQTVSPRKLLHTEKDVSIELQRALVEIGSHSQNSPAENHNFSQHGSEAKIAFFVQISESNIRLFPRLLSRIWHPGNIYCLHFDKKISQQLMNVVDEMFLKNKTLQNVFILPSTVVTYTGISMLLNTLDSMENLLQRDHSWDYYINLSGSDYPLLSPVGIRRLLGQSSVNGRQISFVHFSQWSEWDKFVKHRFKWLHFDLALGFNSNLERSLRETFVEHPILASHNLNITIPKGEAWVIVHRKFCQEAVTSALSRRLLTLFANMQSTPEHFFQTLVWNHPSLNISTVKNSFRLVQWYSSKSQKFMQHPAYLDEFSENRTWLHWNSIRSSRSLFARKFQFPDSQLMDHIDNYMNGAGLTDNPANSPKQFFRAVKTHFNCLICRSLGLYPKQMCTRRIQVVFPPPPFAFLTH